MPEVFDSGMESDSGETYVASHQSEDDTMDTQESDSEMNYGSVDEHLWGYLQPCSMPCPRIDFWRLQACVSLGRGPTNQVILPGSRISTEHCTITWDGMDGDSGVVVKDLSTNGTFINNQKIGRGKTRLLRDGNDISFGSSVPQLGDKASEDYRFIYRHVAQAPSAKGIHKDYDVGASLGSGSYATVYRVLHRERGTWYAAKMIDVNKLESQTKGRNPHEYVGREISIMEGLEHPNICKIYETFFCQGDNNITLVLEYVEGGDLLSYLKRLETNGLSELKTKDLTYQICDAMAYVHSQGVTHRDLKPENILLTADDPPVVKVADFGLSKVVDRQTALRSFCGTWIYLAPEIITYDGDDNGYDNRVDSFSIGGIVHVCLTVEEAFIFPAKSANAAPALRLNMRERNHTALLKKRNLHKNVINFIDCLLRDNPRERPSMEEALAHPWLVDCVPHHGFVPWRENNSTDDDQGVHPYGTDTDSDRTMIMTRAMSKARMKSNTKVRASLKTSTRSRSPRKRPISTSHEGGSSMEFGADSDMVPATPLNFKRIYRDDIGKDSPLRRSARKRKELRV